MNEKAVQNGVHQQLHRKDSNFCHAGIYTLVQRQKMTAVKDRDYFEK
jgi:hypothetical protein